MGANGTYEYSWEVVVDTVKESKPNLASMGYKFLTSLKLPYRDGQK
jgi:hypothetical protein